MNFLGNDKKLIHYDLNPVNLVAAFMFPHHSSLHLRRSPTSKLFVPGTSRSKRMCSNKPNKPSDLYISLYSILVISWPLCECLPKLFFPPGHRSFGKSSFRYIKICSPVRPVVGLGSATGDNTEQMQPFFRGTAYHIIKDSPSVSYEPTFQAKHLHDLRRVSSPFPILSFRLPGFLSE